MQALMLPFHLVPLLLGAGGDEFVEGEAPEAAGGAHAVWDSF